jgi:hypothetical protein
MEGGLTVWLVPFDSRAVLSIAEILPHEFLGEIPRFTSSCETVYKYVDPLSLANLLLDS